MTLQNAPQRLPGDDDRAGSRRAARTLAVVGKAFADGAIGADSTVTAIMDLDCLAETVGRLRASFPVGWRHRFAVKANPLIAVLRELSDLGLDMEAASAGETAACVAAGIERPRISFNSPVKTLPELRDALFAGQPLSIDNHQEFERVARLVRDMPAADLPPIGFRINPQTGAGGIALTSTAHRSSKFGLPILEDGARDTLVGLYRDHAWLTFLHVHSGSQGVPLEKLAESAVVVCDLACDINRAAGRRAVRTINIGGGLPIHCDPGRDNPSFSDYSNALQSAAPDLFSGEFEVETEFGRAIAAPNGVLLARVEYTKMAGGRLVAAIHAGSQLAVRTALAPKDWPLAFTVLDPSGAPKSGPEVATDLAGPCCYGGDLLCRGQMLVRAAPGDFILIHNMGAYGFTAHYDFNLIPRTEVLGASGVGESLCFRRLRGRQCTEAIVQMLA
ncbi:MAG: diaminopimelate decarboxylase [Roseibium sp.]